MAIQGATAPGKNPIEHVRVVQRRMAEGTDRQTEERAIDRKQPEVLLFQKKAEYASVAPKITEVSKPVAEQARVATAAVNKPLFVFQQTGERTVSYTAGALFANLATSSGLKPSEQGSSSGDKKDNGNTFISAHKDLSDIRREAFEDGEVRNIFSVC